MAKKSISELRNTYLNSERRFLEGPRSRRRELLFSFKVFFEFLKGFRALHFVGPCVTVFGSARFKEDHYYYQEAVKSNFTEHERPVIREDLAAELL